MGSVNESSGGGGGSTIDLTWKTLYTKDFSTLSETDLASGGDGQKSIDGKEWNLANVANATAVGVGATSAGMKISVAAATIAKLYYGESRVGCYLWTPLSQYLVGSEAEGRSDVELRVSQRFSYGGSFAGTYEALTYGLSDPSYSNNWLAQITQGNFSNASSDFDRFQSWFPGSASAGLNRFTEANLAYIPNCARISKLQDHIYQSEFSSTVAASLGAAVFIPAFWKESTFTNIPQLNVNALNPSHFFFGVSKYYATGGITSVTLNEFQVEWRPSISGRVVLL